jgi:hypothetical protein
MGVCRGRFDPKAVYSDLRAIKRSDNNEDAVQTVTTVLGHLGLSNANLH